MSTSTIQTPPTIDEDSIAALARQIWEDEGQPEGRAEEHWLKAEEILRAPITQASQSASQKASPKRA